MSEWEFKKIEKEYEGFTPPDMGESYVFAGGCKKAIPNEVPCVCINIRPDKSIGDLTVNCKDQHACLGYVFHYKIKNKRPSALTAGINK